jgi:phage terminase small subunit
MSGPRRSRSALASGKIDNIFEAPGRVNPKVSKKIKESLAEYQKLKEKKPHGPIENLNGAGMADPAIKAKSMATQAEMLNPKQQAYIEGVTREGKSKLKAAYDAGYSSPRTAIQRLETSAPVQKAIATERKAHEEELNMTRKKVVDGLMEAVDMARVKADPLSMVAGWREVAKICGYYEPVKHKVEVSVNGQVLLHQITSMSDEDLLKLADEANVIDGEFTALGHEES